MPMPMPMPMLAACSTAKQNRVCSNCLRAHWPESRKPGRPYSGKHKDGSCCQGVSHPCDTASVLKFSLMV